MNSQQMLDRFVTPLLEGRRRDCRDVLNHAIESGIDAKQLYHDMVWPAMEQVATLYRRDEINAATEHMATRINRVVADQLQAHLPRNEHNGKRILISCADGEPEELGAQMTADLFESEGWDVFFVGGGVPNDEILSLVGKLRPDILLVFGTQPAGVPGVRQLIDLIRDIGPNPTMNIMISGGVFNRAEGVWQEVNAGAPKKRRRRRRRVVETAS